MSLSLDFQDGTITLRGPVPEGLAGSIPQLRFDERVQLWRAPAYRYERIVRALIQEKLAYEDQARDYRELQLSLLVDKAPRSYQLDAIEAWRRQGRRGSIVLPTGSGKSFVAVLAILDRPRSTLVVAPTIDLMNQWHDLLSAYLGVEVGVVGGGSFQVEDITVTTYDSAYLHLNHLGNRFGLIVFDECHHLPSSSYSLAAQLAIAPFRLGLTATLERPDGRHAQLDDLIGPTAFRQDIHEMAGEVLSSYEVETIYVELSEDEKNQYEEARKQYRGFVRDKGISMAGPNGWSRFIIATSKDAAGRAAFEAWKTQRRIAMATPRKLAVLEDLLHEHRMDRVLIFTNDNATVYDISRRFLVPAITHQTKTKERQANLQAFNEGRFPVLVTSKVLNEGVNVPEANIGIVLSGSATVREHVQRLGRILRKVEGKHATLYEVIARGTAEESMSDRRRQHAAYGHNP